MPEHDGATLPGNPNHARRRRRLIRAAAVVDADRVNAAPGVVLLEDDRIVFAGRPEEIGHIEDAEIVARPDSVVVPALVNAHAHLDLSHFGPVNYSGSFVDWIETVRAGREKTEEGIADSVRRGIKLSQAGGVAIVGDIAGEGSFVPAGIMRESAVMGVSFVEVFGLGSRQATGIEALRRIARAADRLDDDGSVRLGVQPHAPYSCGPEVYAFAASLGLPLATHIAETPEEIEFLRDGAGPIADFLQRLGIIGKGVPPQGSHPVDALADTLRGSGALTVHLNDVGPSHFDAIRQWGGAVVYCPRASAYFGLPADEHGHRYREMLDAGIRVALGTDSILCLDTPDRLTPLDDMRLLWRRDRTSPRTLLSMATTVAAEALGFARELATLATGPAGGVLALPADPSRSCDPLAAALERDDPPEWLTGPADRSAAASPQSATLDAT